MSTHIQSVNLGNNTILVTDNTGNQNYFSVNELRIIDHPVYDTTIYLAATLNDLEPGDCVLIKKLDGSQGIPLPTDVISVFGFR